MVVQRNWLQVTDMLLCSSDEKLTNGIASNTFFIDFLRVGQTKNCNNSCHVREQ